MRKSKIAFVKIATPILKMAIENMGWQCRTA
jgi:hypothetical protein